MNSSLAIALIAPTLLFGCDSDRLAQFGSFRCGWHFIRNEFHPFMAGAASAFIAADSATPATSGQG